MKNKAFEPDMLAEITVAHCPGDLVVQGGGDRLNITGDKYETEEGKAGVILRGKGDLVLGIPAGSALVINKCGGDVVLRGVHSNVHLQEAGGDVVLNQMGEVQVDVVHGDLVAKDIKGKLQISNMVAGDVAARRVGSFYARNVQGDLQVRYSEGTVEVEAVHGDVDVSRANEDVSIDTARRDAAVGNIGGHATVREASGDIRLSGPFGPGKHNFKAAGDIVVRWPAESPVKIIATAPNLRDRLNLKVLAEEGNTITGQLGDDAPDTTLVLEANGRIILKESRSVNRHWMKFEIGDDFNFDMDFSNLEGLGEQISGIITDRVTDLESRLGVELAAKVEARAHRAAQQAEKAIDRAMRRAERSAQRRGPSHSVWQGPANEPAQPAAAEKAKGYSSEEQMRVLKMLEQGKITPQEAFTLLEALA